jgi:hypothetical protein
MHKNATKCNETLSKWCKNKHGASKIMDTLETYQELASVVVEIARQGPKKKEPLKRKSENIVQTNYKAKILLNLIDGRWEVIRFVPEQNHPLIQKPSLIKYLRSHSGIPREEKDL